jgi:hypothetical protein
MNLRRYASHTQYIRKLFHNGFLEAGVSQNVIGGINDPSLAWREEIHDGITSKRSSQA